MESAVTSLSGATMPLDAFLARWQGALPPDIRRDDLRRFAAAQRAALASELPKLRRRQTLYERFGASGARTRAMSPARLHAEERAGRVLERLTELLPARDGSIDPEALLLVQFALEDTGSVPPQHKSVEPESMGSRDLAWYHEATLLYDAPLVTPDELPALVGLSEWPEEEVGDLIWAFATQSDRFSAAESDHYGVPDWLFRQQIADHICPDPRFDRLELQVLPRDTAYAFVKTHHSALGGPAKLPPGIQYAIGAVRRVLYRRPELVAVALAGHPTGRWTGREHQHPCGPQEILQLHRVASLKGLYTVDRRGRRVPLNAASMLTARIMDLLPESGRAGHPGCLFVTYSLASERGTTYLALAAKGLRPVALTKGQEAHGARAGGAGTALNTADKIRWEYGPAAAPPDWDILRGIVDDRRIAGAQAAFASRSAAPLNASC